MQNYVCLTKAHGGSTILTHMCFWHSVPFLSPTPLLLAFLSRLSKGYEEQSDEWPMMSNETLFAIGFFIKNDVRLTQAHAGSTIHKQMCFWDSFPIPHVTTFGIFFKAEKRLRGAKWWMDYEQRVMRLPNGALQEKWRLLDSSTCPEQEASSYKILYMHSLHTTQKRRNNSITLGVCFYFMTT